MEFFDCNAFYGYDVRNTMICPVNTIDELNCEMKQAGVSKAMVSRIEQLIAGTPTANDILADDVSNYQNMYGIWGLLPSHTHEIPEGELMLSAMKKNRIYGWRLIPNIGRYLIKDFVLKDWFELAIDRKIPIFINTAHGTGLESIADIMKRFPDLTVVITYPQIWPNDRYLRPFVAEYPNVYLDLSYCITDGGIESFVKEYGANRLLYGSGFPYCYFGANMLMIKHADISQDDKTAIAEGNMTRIIEEVLL
jgi:predicted TIM-barrel fold metal-dependent hydrolase